MADGIKIGNLDVSAFKVGSSDCKIYLGDTLLYPQSPSINCSIYYTYSDGTDYCYNNSSTSLTRTDFAIYRKGGTSSSSRWQSATSVIVGNDIVRLEDNAFLGASSTLTSVTFSDNLTYIGNGGLLMGCSGLTSVVIPSGVTYIGTELFCDCSNLSSVTVNATTPPTVDNINYDFAGTSANLKIYVPCDSVAAYKASTSWSPMASKIEAIPDSCTGQTLQWVSFSAGDAVPSGDVYGIKVSGATAFPSIISGSFFFINDSNDLNVYNGARYRWYYESNSCGPFEAELGLRDDNWELMFNTVCGVDYYSVDTSKTTVIPYDCQLYIYA